MYIMRKRASHKMFREFICSVLLGFITGFLSTRTILLLMWRRQATACRIASLRLNDHHTIDGNIELSQYRSTRPDPRTKRLLFVGVMTTRKYLSTRAEAIYNTWGQHVPGRLVFFVGSGDGVSSRLPVIVLSDTPDGAYPPQKKSFTMLKYMHDNHGQDFEWFMRTDDDIYIQSDRLEKYLRSIDSRQNIYMGHPGTGTPDEAGHLGLHDNNPYCMGGPGVLFTGSALSKLSKHLFSCLNYTVTEHEDSELGRCVQHNTGLSCTATKQFHRMFHQSYREKTGLWTQSKSNVKETALTFHPIKIPKYMFGLRIHLETKRLRTQERKAQKLLEEIRTMDLLIRNGLPFEHEDSLCSLGMCDVEEGMPWDCIIDYNTYTLLDAALVRSVLHRGRYIGLVRARRTLSRYVRHLEIQKGLILDKAKYQRLLPNKGLEHQMVTHGHNSSLMTFRTIHKFDPVYFQVR